ncbi:AsmA-like C-terminal region-containing protein [Anditalea andensis]|uniref:Membrane protein n=1 Tax=Anditalea andensis TaxID=1048983 RepID=A0A074KYA8_9BACT|nr:AsmA-like C-terminal region-containing protein [Anditalea andensis]KEO73175.1 membrane protein [Anditalea andensis]
MKKVAIIIAGLIAFLLIALITVPYLFKDQILARIDREIASSVNAKVYYDYDNVSISLFRRFPDVSATIREFGISGNPPFENDTLMHINSLQVDVNLRSVLFGDYPELTGVHLLGGSMYISVLEDGRANYDIAVETEEEEVAEPSEFKLGIDLIEVKDLNLIYDDRQMGFFMALANFNIEGKGDFTLDVYDLLADARTDIVRVSFDGVNYLENKRFLADAHLNVDLDQMRFTFMDGNFTLNEFDFDLGGFLALSGDDVNMDLSFGGKDNSFRSILSLVPGIYTESFSQLTTSGNMTFEGFVRGTYNETTTPSFDMSLKVDEGYFQYPDLPRPVSNVNIVMHVANTTDDINNTRIEVPAFNMNFGENPISGKLLVENLRTYDMDAQLRGNLKLEEITSIFPMEGTVLRGAFSINATAQGRYDSATNTIPRIDASMSLIDGYIQNEEYPTAIENLDLQANVANTSGNMNDLIINISNFGFDLEGENIRGNLQVNDLNRLNWDGAVHGVVDLGKLMTIFPMENVIMEGRIRADIDTKGNYTDVEAERYERLETVGDIEIMDLYYTDLDLPQGIRIRNAAAEFTSKVINLTKFDARVGQSPITATGNLSNYIAYMFGDNQNLKGTLTVASTRFDINEWLSNDPAAAEDTTQLAIIELPRNIDFSMNVSANEVLYDNLVFSNARGNLNLRDGILSFRDVATSTMGGQVTFSGTYDAQDPALPKFDMTFDVSTVSIQEAFRSLNTVQVFAPVAQHLTGNFSTKFALNGNLGPNMMPVLSSLDGKGLVRVVQAAFQDSRLLQGITSITRLSETNSITLKDLALSTTIEDGRLKVSPFNIRLWDYATTIEGSTGFDGSINYLLNMQVPAGRFGAQLNQVIAGISGTEAAGTTVIPVALNVGGTYQNPNVSLAGGEKSIENLLAGALKSRIGAERGRAEDQIKQVQENAIEQFRAKEDSIRTELRQKAEVAKDSVRREADRAVEEAKRKAATEAKNILRRGFGGVVPAPAKPDTTVRGN